MENLFETEDIILADAKKYIESLNDEEKKYNQKYIELHKAFERFVKQTKRTIRISDKMTSKLNMHKNELTDKAYLDDLTGLYNRRYMKMAFDSCIAHCIRNKLYVSVLLLDIDYFKNYNDTYGHLAGDDCLINVSKAIKQATIRSSDILARFGGEEFIAILPQTDIKGASFVADKMHNNINDLKIQNEKSDISEFITASIGISCLIPYPGVTTDEFISKADLALYNAKKTGRNKSTVFSVNE